MPDKKPDQMDERAAVIAGNHSAENAECLKKCIAAFGRQCASEARRDAFLEAAKAIDPGSPHPERNPVSDVCASWAKNFKARAAESKEGEG